MPLVPEIPAASANPRPPFTTRGLKPSDISPDEMDDVIMRIFKELRKQLSMMENKKADELETVDRERHARILASLERTMERLVKVEAGRAAARKSQVSKKHGNALETFQREVTRIVTIERERRIAQQAGAGGRGGAA